MDESKLLEALARIDEQIKTLFRRTDENRKLAETVHSLALSIERLTNSLNTTNGRVNQLASDVEEMKTRPARRWDTIIVALISALVGAVISYLFRV